MLLRVPCGDGLLQGQGPPCLSPRGENNSKINNILKQQNVYWGEKRHLCFPQIFILISWSVGNVDMIQKCICTFYLELHKCTNLFTWDIQQLWVFIFLIYLNNMSLYISFLCVQIHLCLFIFVRIPVLISRM